MEIERLGGEFTVCRVKDFSKTDTDSEFCFIGKTDGERSLICRTENVPDNTLSREDGWKAFRITGVLDFSLVGITAKISSLLAEEKIPILVVSTFNTDYFLMKKESEMLAMSRFVSAGYRVLTGDRYGDNFMNRTSADIMREYGEQHDEWV